LLVELKSNGTTLDTINLIDLQDGSSATQVGFDHDNVLVFAKGANGGEWNTADYTTTMTFTFYRSGSVVAVRTAVVTLDPTTGLLSVNIPAQTSGEDTTVVAVDDKPRVVTVVARHNDSGASYAESVISVSGGDKGDAGDAINVHLSVPQGTAFQNGTGADKYVRADVYINGALVTDTTEFKYHWTANGLLAYVDGSGNYVGTTSGLGWYPADPDEPDGMNFRTLIVDPNDLGAGTQLNLICTVSNIP
jgi:hypothetical protein